MDPVSLIVAALAAGAVAGAQNTATEAIKDAYTGLKVLIARRFPDRPAAQAALDRLETEPDQHQKVLEAELVQIEAGSDEQLITAAQRLIQLLDAGGLRAGRSVAVDARGAQGVYTGDHGTQTNTFGTPPPKA